ncbi:cysteine desulfurase [Candidatus Peregrinibacteria bacterium]|nr:cysteine desulfurase [Candidatus Peregrinibacteria bacterium]
MIYFDHAATTPLDPRVFEAMKPYFTQWYGNPSSIYRFAQKARQAIDDARERTAKILECVPREVIFTSCGTESNNFFILGAAAAYKKFGKHIITTKIEHDSVLKPLEHLESQGFEVTYLDVGKNGIVDAEDVQKALRPDTIFVTIMYANNEIGTIQPIQEISRVIEYYSKTHPQPSILNPSPLFHTDACQAAPYLDISVKNLGVDAMTLNGGKIYGPKGVGALFIREGVELTPLLFGGGQEYRKRSGTENVPAIVGFAKALSLVQSDRKIETKRLLKLRDKLINGILKKIPESRLNGDSKNRLPNNINVSFRGLEGEAILLRLDMLNIAASSGSACTSGYLEPSHVIRAINSNSEWTHSSTRFSLGHGNTEEEVDFVLKHLPKIIQELREISPFSSGETYGFPR